MSENQPYDVYNWNMMLGSKAVIRYPLTILCHHPIPQRGIVTLTK